MTCPTCGAACPAATRYCPSCGSNLSGAAGASASVTPGGVHGTPTVGGVAGTPLAPGTVLQGRYRIERVLGEGAFGRVYLATDMQDAAGPFLAIKELLDWQFASASDKHEAITWFKREVSTLLTLEHPGIPTIYGYWMAHSTAGPFYLVMDFIPGQTLHQVLVQAGGRVPWQQVVEWGIVLCGVLTYLHSRPPPVVFRDLKLPNVMLDSRTQCPVLIDFGIARQLAQAGGTTIGTPGYAPFEQWVGKAEPRSDLYALGAMLHALLTGRSPEAEYTRLRNTQGYDVAAAMRVLFPPADALVVDVPAGLAQALLRATAFEKDDRFPDAAAMAAALRQVLAAAQAPTVASVVPAALTPTVLVASPPLSTPPLQSSVAATSIAGQRLGGGRAPRMAALVAAGVVVCAAGITALLAAGHILGPATHQRAAAAARATVTPAATVMATATTLPTVTPLPATPTARATPITRVLAVHTAPRPAASVTARPDHRQKKSGGRRGSAPLSQATHRRRHRHQGAPRILALYVDVASQGFEGANLRARPGTAAPVILLILNGVRLQAAPQPVLWAGKVWYKVVYRSHTGYILGSLLDRHTPTPVRTLYVDGADYGYTGVNLRARPNLKSTLIIGIVHGVRIPVLGPALWSSNNEYWYKAAYLGHVGYARAKLLDRRRPPPMFTLYVNAAPDYTGVEVRALPSLNAPIRIGVDNGMPVNAVGTPVMGDNGEYWYKVVYDYKVGYARAILLSRQPPSS